MTIKSLGLGAIEASVKDGIEKPLNITVWDDIKPQAEKILDSMLEEDMEIHPAIVAMGKILVKIHENGQKYLQQLAQKVGEK